MPEIISNTSPILALSNIDRLYLLKKQFGKILIPRAVEEELMLKEGFAGADEFFCNRNNWNSTQSIRVCYSVLFIESFGFRGICKTIFCVFAQGNGLTHALGQIRISLTPIL